MRFVKIALPVNVRSLFTYSIPLSMDEGELIGKRAIVNFHGRKLLGYVVSYAEFSSSFVIKNVERIIDKEPIFTSFMIDFAQWIADYYFSSLGDALALMVPRGQRPKGVIHNSGDCIKDSTKTTFVETKLTLKQQQITDSIINDIAQGQQRFYLYGITGAGKTEIYMKLIETTIQQGKKVIFLVPEIALSFQTMSRLADTFGEHCAMLHSGLVGSKKLGEYLRLLHGQASIAIGTRSALFAPMEDVGLIIMDEENDGAYKSDSSPRYHARSAAMHLAKERGAVLMLGSATPSVESWFYAEKGWLKKYELLERYGGAELPEVKVIDANELAPWKFLTDSLVQEINKRLVAKEQILLLQNRRGFTSYMQCSECKSSIICRRCSINMTWHKSKNKLICHRCGATSFIPTQCPECGVDKLRGIGAGTERIEEEIQKVFPHARVVRIDFDVMQKTKDVNELFRQIEDGEVDIIVGTQMIAKGLHFPKIKLVGVVDADLFINMPDYRAPERSFALLTQVAGRAGRTGEKGFVMIQTKSPTHYAIEAGVSGKFHDFFNEELRLRNVALMPPFSRMIRLVIRGRDEQKVQEVAKALRGAFDGCMGEAAVELLGPSPCLISKINLNFRYQVLMKSPQMATLQQILHCALKGFSLAKGCYLEIDPDPSDLL